MFKFDVQMFKFKIDQFLLPILFQFSYLSPLIL